MFEPAVQSVQYVQDNKDDSVNSIDSINIYENRLDWLKTRFSVLKQIK